MEKFYKTVDKTLKGNRSYYNIVMRIWNGKTDKGQGIQGLLGPHGIGKRNLKRKEVIGFCNRE